MAAITKVYCRSSSLEVAVQARLKAGRYTRQRDAKKPSSKMDCARPTRGAAGSEEGI